MASELVACSLCEASYPASQLFNSESLAGVVSAACEHTTCATCLRAHIQASLPECERRWQTLRVPCPHPGCRKVLSQRLVYEVLPSVKDFGNHVMKQNDPNKPYEFFFLHSCPSCDSPSQQLLANCVCHHYACANCWEKQAHRKLKDMETKGVACLACVDPGCGVRVDTEPLVDKMSEAKHPNFIRCAALAAEAKKALERWEEEDLASRSNLMDYGPVCGICNDYSLVLLKNGSSSTNSNGLAEEQRSACQKCWVKWVEAQFERRPDVKSKSFLRSFAADADAAAATSTSPSASGISEVLWYEICLASEKAARYERLWKWRERLQSNQLFPPTMQVDCPKPDCVGLGYLGFDTVMCFVCEHRWNAEDCKALSADTKEEQIMGLGVKRCPRCQEYIEKNGGCDHMTCRCGHHFSWTTLKNYH